ncbi:MAG: 50S ribosomal protein L25 [Thermoleophilia bacterium]|nr:50S ribosomal protein L25 [Thermoleophilia bacterium]MDQ3858530.1 50S ribosomal protein L25 [Actinomycetota bacterium]
MAGERIRLQVQPREALGSAEARRLRALGFVPGVIYGNGKRADAFAIAERDLRRALTGEHGMHAILDVVIGDGGRKTRHAVLKDYQLHPTRGRLLHVDLQEVRLDQAIHAQVAVELVGEAEGVTMGGVLTQVTRDVNVEALPMDVPDRLELDVSGLAIGDSIRVADLAVPDGVTLLDDPDTVLASVSPPTRVETPEEILEAEEAAAAEGLPAEQEPQGGAEGPAEPDADAAGSPGTVEG